MKHYLYFQQGCDPEATGSAMISRLAWKVRPRYHFAGLEGVQYERLPYRYVIFSSVLDCSWKAYRYRVDQEL